MQCNKMVISPIMLIGYSFPIKLENSSHNLICGSKDDIIHIHFNDKKFSASSLHEHSIINLSPFEVIL